MATRKNIARKSAGAMLLALSLTGMIRAAYADCSPNSVAATAPGLTITCADTATAGFITGANVDALTINITASGIVQARTTSNPSVAILVGAGNIHDDDTFNVITNNGQLVNTGGAQTNNYVVNLNGSHNTLINNKDINLSITTANITGRPAANTATARAIFSSSSASEFEGIQIINNKDANITVQHAGVGNMGGFYPGEDIEDFVIDNYGRVSVERTSTLTVTANGAGALVAATPTVATPATLGIGAAFDGDDDTEQYVIRNHAGGVIEAKGAYTAGVYARAPGVLIVNDANGIIRNNSVVFGPDPNSTEEDPPIIMTHHEIAVSSHGGSYLELDNVAHTATVTIGKTELQNSGTIIGDILMVDANALRYWAQQANHLAILNSQINQGGRRDSEIENHASGIITGDIYLGAGTHEIENAGTITGNIYVNQKDSYFTQAPTTVQNPNNYPVFYAYSGGDDDDDDDAGGGGATTEYPVDKHFTLENTGVLNGNITIQDISGSVNKITLTGDGFTGDITATTGAGTNSLTLLGVGTLHNVSNFSTLTVGSSDAVVGGDDDDDDDDAGPAAPSAVWLLADGTTQKFTAGTIINPGATLIVDSNLISDVTIAEGGVLVAGEKSHGLITGSINNAGTIYLPAALDQQNHATPTTLTVSGSVNMEAGSILRTVITGNGSASADAPSSNAGLLKVGATGDVEAGAKILPVQQTSGLVRNGDWYRIATNTNGGSVFSTLPAVQNTALITWTVRENADSDLVIGATVKGASSIPGISSAGASALNALLSSDNERLQTLVSALQGLTSESAVRKASEQLRPETNGAQSAVALTVNDRVQAVIDQRIAQTNLAYNGASGVSTGEGGSGRAGWVQGFGFYGQQDQRDGVDGYTASTGGIALGADTAIGSGDAMRVGIALSYASSKIDDDGVNTGNTTKIDSYGATLYGTYSMPTWYVNGAVGLGLHKYDSTRQVTVGAIHDTDTAQYDGTQYVAKIEGGLPLKFGKNTLVPLASVSFSHLDQEAYTESSSAGTGLAVEKSSTESVRTGLGAKLLFDVSEPGTNMVVELRAIWLHEFGDASQDSTARFAAGGASFTTSGVDIGRDSANLGIGMRFNSANSRQQVLISYDAEIRDQYIGHTAMLQARQEF